MPRPNVVGTTTPPGSGAQRCAQAGEREHRIVSTAGTAIGARPRRQRPEATIHAAVCDHLRRRAKPDVLWLHPANGGTRDIREAARFKRMGVLAGASDLLLWQRGNSLALELNSPGGRLSDAQLGFLARFNDAGGHSASAEGVDRALAVLEAWGLLLGRRQ
jgi:VRR-NUC domain